MRPHTGRVRRITCASCNYRLLLHACCMFRGMCPQRRIAALMKETKWRFSWQLASCVRSLTRDFLGLSLREILQIWRAWRLPMRPGQQAA